MKSARKTVQAEPIISKSSTSELLSIRFTVDSALLSELGERLVGKPYIALAELVKNSYDADASKVIIRFGDDRIEIRDNGHGMDFEEFRDFWMRVGTPHKQKKQLSRNLKRPLTGSKGIGRLSVQFLAGRLEMRTTSDTDPSTEIDSHVNWSEAVSAGDLTSAEALYSEIPAGTEFPDDRAHGTVILLSKLKQQWTSDEIVKLAQEIWWLQPPMRKNPDLKTEAQQDFEVVLESPDPDAVEKFASQMSIIQEMWTARLLGKLVDVDGDLHEAPRTVQLSLQFAGEPPETIEYPISNCKIHFAEFEIRIFHLMHRQPHGIRVGEARYYLNKNGGVYVYDTGFRLPYYGGSENDWLRVEFDHSHRLSASQLLPQELQVPDGMTYLPTNSRMLGTVHVNTSKEQQHAQKIEREIEDYLKISMTRDRLVDNGAFESLVTVVRWALDYYAVQERKRAYDRLSGVEPVIAKFERVDKVLELYKHEIPIRVYSELRERVNEAVKASETEAEYLTSQIGLLGPLATAGISALALEHEARQQFTLLEDVISKIGKLALKDNKAQIILTDIDAQLKEWITRARATHALFSPMLFEEERDRIDRYKAKSLTNEVVKQIEPLTRGTTITTSGIADNLRLPRGRFIEWSSIFQNVFLNAFNAMLDSPQKLIRVSSYTDGRRRSIIVQDTGCGVDLATADELFEPFVRRLEVSPERRALGYGGSGLGLTIVRMVAHNLGCKVAFVQPTDDFSTAFQIVWSESIRRSRASGDSGE